MILDKRTQFAAAQAVGATAISDTIDTGVARDIGNGEGLFLVIQATEAATAAGAATVVFSLESDSTADLATAPVVHFATPAIGKATLVVGYVAAVIALPLADYKRYVGVRFTVATGPLTAGKFNAFLTREPACWRAYTDGL